MGQAGIKIFAPATLSNLGCGFDILGLALKTPGDEVVARLADPPGVRISVITGDHGHLPKDIRKNAAGISAQAVLDHLERTDVGIDLEIHKRLPVGSGLGSSAASAVAGAMAVNELLKRPLEKRALLPMAMKGELGATGSTTADNVAPCLLGGMILIRDNPSLDIHRLPLPKGLFLAVLSPNITIETAVSRKALNRSVPLEDMVRQTGNIGALVQAVYQSDLELMARCMTDHVIEPQRTRHIPYFHEIRALAFQEGAMACGLSGSGPAVWALCSNSLVAENVGVTISTLWMEKHVDHKLILSGIDTDGAIKC